MTITALREHFTEGEILVSRALRELEAAGYLERRRERTPSGHIRTRTYFYDVPVADKTPTPPRPRKPRAVTDAPAPDRAEKASALPDAASPAVAVLASLRRIDPRLVLSEREAVSLAPAVDQWLAAGVAPSQITAMLTTRLPDTFLTRPAGILAFRLRETPLPAPPPLPPHTPERPTRLPFQTCDGCERAFRAPDPGHCRECRSREFGDRIRTAC